jgi:hypothetical protein
MRSSQTEGADQTCPTDQRLSSPRIEALGNRLIYLLKVVRVEATPGTFVRDIGARSDEEEVFQTAVDPGVSREVPEPYFAELFR